MSIRLRRFPAGGQAAPLDMAGLATVSHEVLPEPPQIIASSIIAKVVIPGMPMSKQRPRFVRKTGAVFTPAETRDRERAIGQYVWAYGWRRPPDPELAFGVRAMFYVADQQRRDVDNMLKLVLDGLNKVIWADDCQVFEIMGWKREDAANPRTELVVYSLGFSAKLMAECAECHKRYRCYPSWRYRQFCSLQCRDMAAQTGEWLRCAKCAVDVYRRRSVLTRNRGGLVYCSRDCRVAALTDGFVCPQCGVHFRRALSLVRTAEPCCSLKCVARRRVGRPKTRRVVVS